MTSNLDQTHITRRILCRLKTETNYVSVITQDKSKDTQKIAKKCKKRLHFAPKGHFFRVFESFCFCIGSKKIFKKRNEILRVAWWTPKFMLKDWVLAPLINSTLNILNLQPPLSTRNFSKSENTGFLISQSFVV